MDVYWLEQTEADMAPGEAWLSSHEQLLLNRLRFPKRRAEWKLGRWTAKQAIAIYLHLPDSPCDLADIEILPAASGAPQVWVSSQLAPAALSLSHSAGSAVCAVAPFSAALGCDLELIEPRTESFVSDYFEIEERAAIAAVACKDRPLLVTLLWSAKESALKALGVGLRLDTRSAVVSLVGEPQQNATSGELCSSGHRDLAELCRALQWQRLQVCVSEGRRFDGWWQHAGKFVRTLIAAPAPESPICLSGR